MVFIKTFGTVRSRSPALRDGGGNRGPGGMANSGPRHSTIE
nr:MAG TPA: hypothetical protein [Caudoviricetes sp.]